MNAEHETSMLQYVFTGGESHLRALLAHNSCSLPDAHTVGRTSARLMYRKSFVRSAKAFRSLECMKHRITHEIKAADQRRFGFLFLWGSTLGPS